MDVITYLRWNLILVSKVIIHHFLQKDTAKRNEAILLAKVSEFLCNIQNSDKIAMSV